MPAGAAPGVHVNGIAVLDDGGILLGDMLGFGE
jgi:hypothetical protein